VEQRLGIAAETVERIVRNRIEDAKGKKIDPQRHIERLGMDEISLRKGHKGYATIMTDLTDPTKVEILAVAKGRDEEAGQECLMALSEQQRLKVLYHHTDMGQDLVLHARARAGRSQRYALALSLSSLLTRPMPRTSRTSPLRGRSGGYRKDSIVPPPIRRCRDTLAEIGTVSQSG
jgi:transposase